MPKNKLTGLSMYIEEVLKPEKYALQGRYYKTHHLVAEAHERYKDLSDVEKIYYVNLAKEQSLNKKRRNEIQSIVQANAIEQRMSMEWKKAINVYLDKYKSTDELEKHRFHIVGVQHALRTDEGEYHPLELGVVQWSMEAGIDNSFHTFLDPGKTPLGYSYQVQAHAEETHQMNEERFKDFPNDYGTIWQQFYSFISLQGAPHPVYCMKKNIAQVRGSLEWLGTKAWVGRQVKVLPIEELVIQLFSVVGVSSFPLSISSFLTSVRFEHLKNTRCSQHNNLASEHCALGHAKMISYLISEALSKVFGFQITKKHIPEDEEEEEEEAKPRRGIADFVRNDEEETDEDDGNDSDDYDDESDDHIVNTFMNVNDFRVEFAEDLFKNDNIAHKSGYKRGCSRGNTEVDYRRSKGFHGDDEYAAASFNGKRARGNGRGRSGYGKPPGFYGHRGSFRGGDRREGQSGRGHHGWGGGEEVRRNVQPFGSAAPKEKTILKSSEILITDEKNVAEGRMYRLNEMRTDGRNSFNYDNYTNHIQGNNHNSVYENDFGNPSRVINNKKRGNNLQYNYNREEVRRNGNHYGDNGNHYGDNGNYDGDNGNYYGDNGNYYGDNGNYAGDYRNNNGYENNMNNNSSYFNNRNNNNRYDQINEQRFADYDCIYDSYNKNVYNVNTKTTDIIKNITRMNMLSNMM